MITFLKNKNEFLIFFIIGFFVFALTGNYTSDYIRLVFIKLFLIFLISREVSLISEVKKKFRKKNLITVLIILFFISITISFIFSPLDINQSSIETSGVRYMHSITNILLFVSLYFYFYVKNINYKYLFNFILFSGLLIFISISIIYIFKIGQITEGRMQIFFGNTRQVGLFLTFIICFLIGCLVHDLKNHKNKIIITLPFFLSLVILLGNRASLISVFATLILFFLINIILKQKVLKIFLIFFLSLGVGILIKDLLIFASIIISGNKFIFNESFDITRLNLLSIYDRIEQWKYGVKIFLENLYFGLGSNGFAISALNEKYQTGYPIFAYYSHPHNLFIQFLVEWGLVGTLLLLLLLGGLFYSSIKCLVFEKKKIILIPGLGIIALSIHGLVDGSYYHPITSFYLVLSFSLLSAEIIKKNK